MREIISVLCVIFLLCTEQTAGDHGSVKSVFKSAHGADNATHIVPLLKHLKQRHPVCYYSLKSETIQPFCTVLCKTAGFQLCERSYVVKLSEKNTMSKGLSVDVECTGEENNAGRCKWTAVHETTCSELLAIHCKSCNKSLDVLEDEFMIVNVPQYSPCTEQSACEWNIYLRKNEQKATSIKFKGFKNVNSSGDQRMERIISIQWTDYKGKNHFIEESDEYFTLADYLKIDSDKFVLSYFARNCSLLGAHKKLQLVINERRIVKRLTNEVPKTRLVPLILPLTILLTGMATVTLCLCYNIRSKSRYQEYDLQKVSSYKELNCLTGITSGSKNTVDDYLASSWESNKNTKEKQSEIQLGSVTRYTVRSKGEIKVERSVSSDVKAKSTFVSKQHTNSNPSAMKVSSATFDVPENLSVDCISQPREGNSPSRVRRWLFPCCKKKHDCSVYGGRLSVCERSTCSDLDDLSLENYLCKFNGLVLAFQWSETTSERSEQSSACEVDDLAVVESADVTRDFSSGQNRDFPEVPCVTAQGTEQVDARKTSGSEKSCFSDSQDGHPGSEADTFASANSGASNFTKHTEYGSVLSL